MSQSHLALYRQWRPQTFDEVVAQKQVVYPLQQSIINGEIGHAYLFSGTRGTGKTSLAKIFAKAVNCLDPQNGNPCNRCSACESINSGASVDVLEMDAASNNSVDNIRRITDEVIFTPVETRYKVYIIDEVHMLSGGAFNALLKTLEEPPAHAVFILATTEPHRIPATIHSRCQRFDFRRIPVEDIIAHLRKIAGDSGIDIEEDGLQAIARLSDGALRDAISLLDQAATGIQGTITQTAVHQLVGLVQDHALQRIAQALLTGQVENLLVEINELVLSGHDLNRFLLDLAQYFRNVLILQVTPDPGLLLQTSEFTLGDLRQLAAGTSADDLIAWIKGVSALIPELRWSRDARTVLEINLLKFMHDIGKPDVPPAQPQQAKAPRQPRAAADQPERPQALEPAAQPEPPQTARTAPPPELEREAELALPAAAGSRPADAAMAAKPQVVAATQVEDEPQIEIEPQIAASPQIEDRLQTKIEPQVVATPQVEAKPQTEATPQVEAEPQLEAKLQTEAATQIEAEPRLEAKPQSEASPESNLEPEEIWRRVLHTLMHGGDSILSLMAEQAVVTQTGETWVLTFSPSTRTAWQEISKAEARNKLLRALRQEVGHAAKLTVETTDTESAAGFVAEEPWLRKLRQAAEPLNVPLDVQE